MMPVGNVESSRIEPQCLPVPEGLVARPLSGFPDALPKAVYGCSSSSSGMSFGSAFLRLGGGFSTARLGKTFLGSKFPPWLMMCQAALFHLQASALVATNRLVLPSLRSKDWRLPGSDLNRQGFLATGYGSSSGFMG
jgi:hypothetical protein